MKNAERGFTLIELIITIGIMAIIVGITVVGFQNFANYKRYDAAVATLKTSLFDARTAARSSVQGEPHGVKIGTNSITTFVGNTYSAADPDNVTITFSEITFTDSLTGGTDEITFTELKGLPSATGTIEVYGTFHNATTTITITSAGVIQ